MVESSVDNSLDLPSSLNHSSNLCWSTWASISATTNRRWTQPAHCHWLSSTQTCSIALTLWRNLAWLPLSGLQASIPCNVRWAAAALNDWQHSPQWATHSTAVNSQHAIGLWWVDHVFMLAKARQYLSKPLLSTSYCWNSWAVSAASICSRSFLVISSDTNCAASMKSTSPVESGRCRLESSSAQHTAPIHFFGSFTCPDCRMRSPTVLKCYWYPIRSLLDATITWVNSRCERAHLNGHNVTERR